MKSKKYICVKYFLVVAVVFLCICAGTSGDVCAMSKNKSDIKALKKIISVQNKRGAKVSKNINNKKQYVWNKRTGRLKIIQWRGKQLKGSINFNALTGLRKLNVSKNNITKLSIQKLVKLTNLNCSHNQLKKIGIRRNKALKNMNCSHNYLKSLSVSKYTELCDLDCSYNQLKKLKIKKDVSDLNCSHNQLKRLKMIKDLASLNCSYNQLTKLKLNKKIFLTNLNCSHNKLAILELDNSMKFLSDINCSYNKLKTLTLAKHKYLRWFNCSHNQLTELNIDKSITLLWDMDCSNNHLKTLSKNIFKNLFWLKCDHNQLTALNIQKPSKNLEKIICDNKVQLSGFNPEIIYDSVKDTQVSFLSVDKETMDVDITNNTGKWLCIQESFILEKKVNGQWETMKCTEDTTVNKLLFVPKSKTREFVIKWKDYFGKKLGKGEYRMRFWGTKAFTIE